MGLALRGGYPGGLKGRLIFETQLGGELSATHIITLSDSNPVKTQAAFGNRPSWDATDSFIGTDQVAGDYFNTQISFGSPISISNYIANVGDGVNWLERLTAALKSFKVPVSAPAYKTISNCTSVLGSCESAPAGMVSIAPGTTSVTVSTTSVHSKSEIQLDENMAVGDALGVSCDRSFGRQYRIDSQVEGVEFTIESSSAPVDAACLTYTITN
jgi:hypothetical protein